jgi:hypothetical protein
MRRLKNYKIILIGLFIPAILAGMVYLFSGERIVSHPEEHISQKRELTIDDVRNATYHIESGQVTHTVTLKDGRYTHTSEDGRTMVVIINQGKHGDQAERVAFGHLDGDENKDAAVVLLLNTGGTGDFMILAALINQNGVPFHKASAHLGDRVIINSIKIRDKAIVVDMITHGPDDPANNPTVKKVAEFRLKGNELEEITHAP